MRFRLVLPLLALTCSGLLFVGLHLRGRGVPATPHNPVRPRAIPDSESDPSTLEVPSQGAGHTRETRSSVRRAAREMGKTAWLEVVDPKGRPAAGVPVMRATETVNSRWSKLGTSGLDGLLPLPGSGGPGRSLVVAAEIGLEGARGPTLEIPAEALEPGQVTQLTLPISAGLELRLVGAEDQLLDAWGEAKLSVFGYRRKVPMTGGRALFDGLLPSADLRATIRLGSWGSVLSKTLESPMTLGERRVAKFSIGVQTVLRARLLDDGGRPLVNARFSAGLLGRGPRPAVEDHRTDENGRCLFLVDGSAGSAPFFLYLQDHSLRGVRMAARVVEIPSLPRGGLLTLGDLRLQDTQLLASGSVINAEGYPVRGAQISMESRVDVDGEWVAAPEIGTSSSRNGSFVVRGLDGSRQFRLVAYKRAYLASEPVTCERGQTELTLTLRLLGSLNPTFEWSWGDPKDFLDLRLRGPSANSEARQGRWGPFLGLSPGAYELTIRLRGTDRMLLSLPSLEVPIDGPCADPRLHPIRLDGLLSVVTLTVLDPEGSPIPDATALSTEYYHRWGEGESWRTLPGDQSGIAIPTPLQGSLTVRAPGRQPVEIPAPFDDRSVTLERCRPVVLRLPAALPEDWEGWLLLSSQQPGWGFDGDYFDRDFEFGQFSWPLILSPADIDGRVIHPPGPGSFRATWYGADAVARGETGECGSAEFHVPEGKELLEIVLPLPDR